MPAKAWPTTCCRSSSTWAPFLQTQRLCIWQPNPEHVAARSGFVDKVWNGLFVSTPKGQTVASILCIKAASAFAISVFNLLVSRELLWWLCILLIYCIILVRGDFIFLWTEKTKNKPRGVFEISVTAIRCHQGLENSKHQINYFSKENFNLDRQVPDPHGRPSLWGIGCWDRGWRGKRQRRRFVLSFPGHLASKWSEMLYKSQQKWLVFKGVATCFREHFSQSHAQVGKHKMYILSRIKFGTVSQLALVITPFLRLS